MTSRADLYKSVFEFQFFPREAVVTPFVDPSSARTGNPDELQLKGATDWDIAVRYHDLKAQLKSARQTQELRELSVAAILRQAQMILGSVVHPTEKFSAPWKEVPSTATQVDFDIDTTLDEFGGIEGDLPTEIWMEFQIPRKHPLILTVDTSLSMTGEKLALTAVALAVVLLEFPDNPVGLVAFENESKVIKRPNEKISIEEFVARFLDVPAQGYTHLEEGLRGALRLMLSGSSQKRFSTVLLTDGKYTAGRDPAYLAQRFPHLVVLKMGTEKAPMQLCQELAQKGHGALHEVGKLETLPLIMYGVVKDLLRGRSFDLSRSRLN